MTENLRVTRYDTESPRSGSSIAVATNHPVDIDKPYYINVQHYEESPYTDNLTEELRNSLGLLYNWSAAVGTEDNNKTIASRVQGICPNGWVLPRSQDWDSLFYYLDGKEYAGQKLKSMYGWYTFSGSGTNESGMDCFPAGLAVGNSVISMVGQQTMFWSSTNQLGSAARARVLKIFYDQDDAETPNIYKYQANSVRCVFHLD